MAEVLAQGERGQQRLEVDLLAALASAGNTRRFPPQTILIHEGDRSEAVFVVLDGRLKVYSTGEDGKSVVINVHGAGEIVGELALDGAPRSASVMTLEASHCAIVTGANLRTLIVAYPDFALHLIHKLVGRVRHATERMKSLALEGVYARLVRLLNDSCVAHADGTRHLARPMTQIQIAEPIGSSREMVRRVLKDLVAGKYIEFRDRAIVVLRPLPPRW